MTKIFIDFDQTLFDSAKMLRAWVLKLDDPRVNPGDVVEIYRAAATKRRPLSLKQTLDDFKSHLPHFPEAKAEAAVVGMLGELKNFVYPDVWPFLDAFRDYDLNLITSGEHTLQTARIRAAGLEKYFNEIVCTEGPKERYLVKTDYRSEKTILVDDNPITVDAVEKSIPEIVTVWLNRPANLFSNMKPRYNDFEAPGFDKLAKLMARIH